MIQSPTYWKKQQSLDQRSTRPFVSSSGTSIPITRHASAKAIDYSSAFSGKVRSSDAWTSCPAPPPYVALVESQTTAAQWMLELSDNWDDNGSARIEASTFSRAIEFINKQGHALWNAHYKCMDLFRLSPGPQGCVDIVWKSDSYELAITIDPNDSDSVQFYADDLGRSKRHIKGILGATDDISSILMYLRSLK